MIEVYHDLSATALNFYLIEGNLDPSQFQVYARDRIELPNFEVEVNIIGKSHLILFRKGDFLLQEIVACGEVDGGGKIFSESLKYLSDSVEHRYTDKIQYSFRSEIVDLSEGGRDLQELKLEVENCRDGAIGLAYAFPNGSLATTPETIVGAKAEGDKILVNTAHSYPSEGKVVFTHSSLTLLDDEIIEKNTSSDCLS